MDNFSNELWFFMFQIQIDTLSSISKRYLLSSQMIKVDNIS